jgi:hypothetical protein
MLFHHLQHAKLHMLDVFKHCDCYLPFRLATMSDSASVSVGFFGEDRCVICRVAFDDNTVDKVCLGNKGMKTLLEYSIVRGDSELKSFLDGKPGSVNVHYQCRKVYTNPCRKFGQFGAPADSDVPEQPKKKLRSMSVAFDWHTNCLFCGKCVEGGQPAHSAMTLQMKDTVEKKCLERNDDWAREVHGRINACADLPSHEAVYHGQCQINFYTGRKIPGEGSTRADWRQHDEKRDYFEIMCQWLEQDAGDQLQSVTELRERMVQESGVMI